MATAACDYFIFVLGSINDKKALVLTDYLINKPFMQKLSRSLEGVAKTRNFKAGEIIVRQGQLGDCAYVVKSGMVTVFRESDDGDFVLASLGVDEIFGEMALLRFDSYTLSVRAEEDCTLFVLPPSLVNDQIKATPPLIQSILAALLDRMHEVNTALLDLDQTGRKR